MCIIIYKPKSINKSNIKDLKQCFNYNPDGSGVMWNDGKKVHIEKGLMNYNDLEKALEKIPNNADIVIHCRIGTSGTNSKSNCHPYPLYSSIKKMKMLKNDCEYAIAHNGILKDYEPGKINKYDINDTQLFILRFMNMIKKDKLCKDTTKKIIESNSLFNRLAIMNKNDVILTGEWVQKNQIYYSNLNHDYTLYKRCGDLWYDDCYYDDYSYYDCEGDCDDCDCFKCEYNPMFEKWLEIREELETE